MSKNNFTVNILENDKIKYSVKDLSKNQITNCIHDYFNEMIDIDIENDKRINTLDLMSLDAIIQLFKNSIEMVGINKRSAEFYQELNVMEVKLNAEDFNGKNIYTRFNEARRIYFSIDRDEIESNIAKNYKFKMDMYHDVIDRYRKKLISYAWNNKMNFSKPQ